jgi:hypothetical protein
MEPDSELEGWRRQWQTDEVIPHDLRQRVERETRNLRRGIYAQIAVTVVMGGGAAGWAVVSQRPIAVALAAGIWFFIAVAWATSYGLSRDIVRPSAATTAAFLDLSIERCRRRLQGLTAQAVLYVLILAFDLVWIYHYMAETQPVDPWAFLTSRRMFLVWAVTAVLAALAVWFRQRFVGELRNLLNLRRQLGDSER